MVTHKSLFTKTVPLKSEVMQIRQGMSLKTTWSPNEMHYKLRQNDIQQKGKKFWLANKLKTLNTFPLICF